MSSFRFLNTSVPHNDRVWLDKLVLRDIDNVATLPRHIFTRKFSHETRKKIILQLQSLVSGQLNSDVCLTDARIELE
jgi:hypothetical protein